MNQSIFPLLYFFLLSLLFLCFLCTVAHSKSNAIVLTGNTSKHSKQSRRANIKLERKISEVWPDVFGQHKKNYVSKNILNKTIQSLGMITLQNILVNGVDGLSCELCRSTDLVCHIMQYNQCVTRTVWTWYRLESEVGMAGCLKAFKQKWHPIKKPSGSRGTSINSHFCSGSQLSHMLYICENNQKRRS